LSYRRIFFRGPLNDGRIFLARSLLSYGGKFLFGERYVLLCPAPSGVYPVWLRSNSCGALVLGSVELWAHI